VCKHFIGYSDPTTVTTTRPVSSDAAFVSVLYCRRRGKLRDQKETAKALTVMTKLQQNDGDEGVATKDPEKDWYVDEVEDGSALVQVVLGSFHWTGAVMQHLRKTLLSFCVGEEPYSENQGDIRSLRLAEGQYEQSKETLRQRRKPKVVLVYLEAAPVWRKWWN
jgi:hypothetical protein